LRKQLEVRRWAVAHIGEDRAGILGERIARDPDVGHVRVAFGRPLRALPRAVELPAVIHAADALALDPAGVQHAQPVRAAPADQIRAAALAAVEREVLAEHAERPRRARLERRRARDRLPEAAQQLAHVGAAGGLREELQLVRLRMDALGHAPPRSINLPLSSPYCVSAMLRA
jgi:hypothetical protein